MVETSGSPLRTAAEAKCVSVQASEAPAKAKSSSKSPAAPHRIITRTTPEESTCRLLLTLCSHPELPTQQSFHEHSARSFAFDIRSTGQHIRPPLAVFGPIQTDAPKAFSETRTASTVPVVHRDFRFSAPHTFKETALV